jgi:hypothetical protein
MARADQETGSLGGHVGIPTGLRLLVSALPRQPSDSSRATNTAARVLETITPAWRAGVLRSEFRFRLSEFGWQGLQDISPWRYPGWETDPKKILEPVGQDFLRGNIIQSGASTGGFGDGAKQGETGRNCGRPNRTVHPGDSRLHPHLAGLCCAAILSRHTTG